MGETEVDLLAMLIEHGVLLESARGPIPNAAEIVAGGPIKGSWWGHPRSHTIYAALSDLDESPDVARMRLVNGKVTLVHRRVWPALVRLADHFTPPQLAVLHEAHTASGAHRVTEQPFPDWVLDDVSREAATMTAEQAAAMLPECLRP